MRKIEIFDTSLRDWFQWSKKNANIKDKIEIAEALWKFWVDAIEVWFARSSKNDFEAIKQSWQKVNARVYSLARLVEADIIAAYDSVKEAKNFWIHIFIWTSPSHREKLWKNKQEILISVKKFVSFTESLLNWKWRLMFSAEDALRTEQDFLLEVFKVAVDSGAQIVNIPDTVWFSQVGEIGPIVKSVRAAVWEDVQISVHNHNDLWLATATTIEAVVAWADIIQGTFPPLFGERAWNVDLSQIITNLIKRKDYYDFELNSQIQLKNIYPLVSKISEITWDRIPEKRPIIGKGVHTHWSGIHQDWVNKRSDTYEILAPEEIGLIREQSFFLTNLSWRSGLKNAIKKYFLIDISEEKLTEFYSLFMKITEKKDYIQMDDIRKLLLSEWYNIKKNIIINDYDILLNSQKKVLARATFDNNKDSQYIWEWVWPVDAIFNLIREKYDRNKEVNLIDFTIDALWKQTDVQAKVYIKLQVWWEVYEEEAISQDIVKASLHAIVNGMDRIIRDKKVLQI